jgi:hypothetical protein
MEKEATQTNKTAKKPYQTPNLFLYGTLRELTQSGRVGQTDDQTTPNQSEHSRS